MGVHARTPNTITYAVPSNSRIGKKIQSARLGIVFHTRYTGKTMQDLRAGFGTVTGGGGRNVFLASAGYKDTSGMSKFTSGELSKFDNLIRMAEGSLQKSGPVLNLLSSLKKDFGFPNGAKNDAQIKSKARFYEFSSCHPLILIALVGVL